MILRWRSPEANARFARRRASWKFADHEIHDCRIASQGGRCARGSPKNVLKSPGVGTIVGPHRSWGELLSISKPISLMRLSAFSSHFRSPVLKLHERSESHMNGIRGAIVPESGPGSGGDAFRRLDGDPGYPHNTREHTRLRITIGCRISA